MEFTVKMSKWVRGGGMDSKYGSSLLLNYKGNMCCLGFKSVACGIPESSLKNIGSPCGLFTDTKVMTGMIPEGLRSLLKNNDKNGYSRIDNSKICYELMQINDDCLITDEERIKKLTETFAEIGDTVKFEE